MKQVSAHLKSRGATAAVLTLALGAAICLNWSFSRNAPAELTMPDTVETSAGAAGPIPDPLAAETAAAHSFLGPPA